MPGESLKPVIRRKIRSKLYRKYRLEQKLIPAELSVSFRTDDGEEFTYKYEDFLFLYDSEIDELSQENGKPAIRFVRVGIDPANNARCGTVDVKFSDLRIDGELRLVDDSYLDRSVTSSPDGMRRERAHEVYGYHWEFTFNGWLPGGTNR